MNGILLIDKPSGWTSFDVVNYVRKMVASREGKKPKHVKVGHTGTLDPLATGLLVILIGSYTKQAARLSKSDKTYEVIMELGRNSTTGDAEGITTRISTKRPTPGQVKQALDHFTGKILQTPPAFSAIKVNGQRAYKLARAGRPVQLAPRPVEIYHSVLSDYDYPSVGFTLTVSSGTYIRSLVEDIGAYLTTGAYLTGLRRLQVGKFSVTDAVKPQAIDLDRDCKNEPCSTG